MNVKGETKNTVEWEMKKGKMRKKSDVRQRIKTINEEGGTMFDERLTED